MKRVCVTTRDPLQMLPINWGEEAEDDDLGKYAIIKNLFSKHIVLEICFDNFTNPSLVFPDHANIVSTTDKFPKLINWEIERASIQNEMIDGSYKEVLSLGVQFSVELEISDVDIENIYDNSDDVVEQLNNCNHMAFWSISNVVFTEEDSTYPELQAEIL